MSNQAIKKLTLYSLVLMIFTSVFGFANIPRAFFLMGYAAVPWYILGALAFFIPYAFMLAEYGAAFKQEKGGIFSWMQRSVGAKYAFIGTFMWYASYLVWQVSVSSSIWIPLSNAIFGEDRTSQLTFMGLNSTQVIGILGIIWINLVTFISSRGMSSIKKVTSVGGFAVALLNVALLVGGLLVLFFNGGRLAEPITHLAHSLSASPNPKYQSRLSILSFFTYALFAYGGIEAVGGLVDQTEKAEKTFPKGVAISAIIISIGYSLGIFMIGIFINWQNILSLPSVNTANVTYIIMNNLGYELAKGLGISQATALIIGAWIARFAGLAMFLALTGAFFTLIYSPLKQLIEGTPAALWPKSWTVIKNDMPVHAMIVQSLVVSLLILLVSFGGENASAFFNKLVTMTNVAMTIPYMFLSIAFPFFKKKASIYRPFEIYTTYTWALITSIIVTVTIGLANIFSIIEPALTNNNLIDSLLTGGGPILFALVAYFLYTSYENKIRNKKIKH
ncbi:glutamate/gamma-aminobutyrate family transporter YjeM [Sporanaerobium hydrogeniformans]|uniref:Glutamate/gamma-aminobutyrate family transporter YjeM n=1 Tax=Sporanaerobium hydrogeniformans TaxID=3072179 RepID=A0AC61D9J8_9FIRM|nr:glutamate/gamma-aminobutyrate family transporter YjeM [Sporanaerobium hydrogeniformans]PHV69500.1 glutamate/gamma-aminobutyrate family transporter YjeM [Sporanaerobium hydrogeniformans]